MVSREPLICREPLIWTFGNVAHAFVTTASVDQRRGF